MLTPCPRCRRHVRAETTCPFCAAPSSSRTRAVAALPIAVGLALAGCGGTATLAPEPGADDGRSNGGEQTQPPDEEIRTAPAYGAAPLPPQPPPEERVETPAYGGPPEPADPRPIAAYGAPPMPPTP